MDPITFENVLSMFLANGQDVIAFKLSRTDDGVKLSLEGVDSPEFTVVEDVVLPPHELANYKRQRHNAMTRRQVQRVIDGERSYQDGLDESRTDGIEKGVGGYLTLLRELSRRADAAFYDNAGNDSALEQVRKLGAVAVHCMEVHGVRERECSSPAQVATRVRTPDWEFEPGIVPSTDDVKEALKSLHQEHGLDVSFSAFDIARAAFCDPDVLIDWETETGPLWELQEQGAVGGQYKSDDYRLYGGSIEWDSF